MSVDEARAFVDLLRATFNLLEDTPKPTIAAVEGSALGGGLELILAADIRVAGADATFGVPETSLGIIPGAGGTFRLPKLVGLQRAKTMAFTAQAIGAEEACRVGLVASVVPAGSALEEALKIAHKIPQNGPLAGQAVKKAMEDGYGQSRDAGLAAERRGYEQIIDSEDRLEGLKAFAEKRKPIYLGK